MPAVSATGRAVIDSSVILLAFRTSRACSRESVSFSDHQLDSTRLHAPRSYPWRRCESLVAGDVVIVDRSPLHQSH